MSEPDGLTETPIEQMSKKEYRRFMFAATLSALAIGLAFAAVIILFVLFCYFVWLR
ncbi:MAG: hypothetical protein FWF03_00120 [Defluviitaleaceae bacterium]|nr:hypothetical protein [Defluviitaleaceae bacterium]